MAHFGKVLFSGSRFIFRVLTPVLLLLMVATSLRLTDSTASIVTVCLVVGLDMCVLLLIMALYDPRRFWWAGRGATGLVFIAYMACFADEIYIGKPWRFGPRSEETPVNALLGLICLGLPCLRYALVGRFGGEQGDTTGTFKWAEKFSEPCPCCGEALLVHDWTMFASTVASATTRTEIEEFFSHIKAHEWRILHSMVSWQGDQDNLQAFVLRCTSGGLLFIRLDPYELHEPDGLCGREIIPADEMTEIESLVPATSWHPGPPFFAK